MKLLYVFRKSKKWDITIYKAQRPCQIKRRNKLQRSSTLLHPSKHPSNYSTLVLLAGSAMRVGEFVRSFVRSFVGVEDKSIWCR